MTVQACLAGRNLPAKNLLKRIMTSRGYQVDDATNPAECVQTYVNGQNRTCRLMVVEFTGPETLEMIEVAIERARILPENVAVLANNGGKETGEVRDFGYALLPHPFSMESFIGWVVASENRCLRKLKARRET